MLNLLPGQATLDAPGSTQKVCKSWRLSGRRVALAEGRPP